LLLWERHQEEQNAGIEGDLFVAPKSTTAQQQTANNANLSEFYERELKPKYNEIFYPTNFNRIIKKLNAHGLVVKQGMAYSLTDLGTFVAEQLLKITEMEALN
jgi:superfamily II helicase